MNSRIETSNTGNPADLIRHGAKWQPGAWTPARCALWHQSNAEHRARLEAWIMGEFKRGVCHRTQLPQVAQQVDAA